MQVYPSQISPGDNFDIFYFFRDPNDSGTHYVRARVYDLQAGTLLSTIDLSQAPGNSRLFIQRTQAPADPVGTGRNIVAVATVYTDSAYASPDLNYAEQEQYFLIKNPQAMFGGGGVDMRALGDHLEKLLDKKLAALPKPTAPAEFPTNSLFGSIGKLQETLNRVPKETPDHTPLHRHMKAVRADITRVQELVSNLPAPERLDLSPVLTKIEELVSGLATLHDHVATTAQAPVALIEQKLQEMAPALLKTIEEQLSGYFQKQNIQVSLSDLFKEKPAEGGNPDLAHLMP
jgi:hypothetical protein